MGINTKNYFSLQMKLSQDLLNLISHLHEELYYSHHFSAHVLPELLIFTSYPKHNPFYLQNSFFTDKGLTRRGLALSHSKIIYVVGDFYDCSDELPDRFVEVPDVPAFGTLTLDAIEMVSQRTYYYPGHRYNQTYTLNVPAAAFTLWGGPLKYDYVTGAFIHYYHQIFYPIRSES